jgi:DNA-binding protein HU-beta
MNKSDLVDALADATGMTKADAAKAVDAMFSPDGGIIARALKGGKRVQITGFGTFESKHRKARQGRNPRTGQTIQIAATNTPGFRAGKGLKDAIN